MSTEMRCSECGFILYPDELRERICVYCYEYIHCLKQWGKKKCKDFSWLKEGSDE